MVAQGVARLASSVLAMFLVLGFVPNGHAQDTTTILQGLRAKGADLLVRSSQFACAMELRRVQRKKSQELSIEEQARLEVAWIDGKERYSWPGETAFRDDELRDVLVAGLTGGGTFGGHLRAVVFGSDSQFGEARAVPGNTGAVLIPYRVAAARSGYLVNVDGKEIEAAIAGEIVVQSREGKPFLVAFTLRTVDLPPDFPASAVSEAIYFGGSVVFGEGGIVPAETGGAEQPPPPDHGLAGVPTLATQRMVERTGDEYSNRIAFTNCREFIGESTILLAEEAGRPGNPAPKPGPALRAATRPVPRGVPLDLELDSSISWGKQRTGDEIEALATRATRWKGSTIFGEGARVRGRIVELKKVSGKTEGLLVGLAFTEVIDEKTVYPVSLTLEALTGMPKGPRWGIAAMVHGEQAQFRMIERTGPGGAPYPGAGFFQAAGAASEIPKGLEMRWIIGDARP